MQKNADHIAMVVNNNEYKVRIFDEEKESLLKKMQEILEKFSSVKFELSQLKRLVYASNRERFVAGGEDGLELN